MHTGFARLFDQIYYQAGTNVEDCFISNGDQFHEHLSDFGGDIRLVRVQNEVSTVHIETVLLEDDLEHEGYEGAKDDERESCSLLRVQSILQTLLQNNGTVLSAA